MAAAEMPISVKLAPEEVRLMHDLSSVFWLPSGDFDCWFSLTAAVTKHEDIFTAETQGHRIVKQEPEMLPAPFVVHFTGDGEDLVVFCYKHRSGISYFYGVTAAKVKDFVPPTKPSDFKEETLFRTVKCCWETVSHATPLVDTESCKFKAKFLSILALTKMFVATKLTTLGAFEKWQNKKSFSEIAKLVLERAEIAERKIAKEKGDKANDNSVFGRRRR